MYLLNCLLQNPIEKWQILFWLGAAVCIACMLIFIAGGSGQVQSWNVLKPSGVEEGGGQGETAGRQGRPT